MRRLLLLLPFILLASCLNEDNADLGSAETFVKYYNGGGDDSAVAIRETADNNFIILANTTLNGGRIKLIKTDITGKVINSKLFPESTDVNVSYKGFGIELLPDNSGYAISGQYVANGVSQLYVIVIASDLESKLTEKVFTSTETGIAQLKGKAIIVEKDASGNLTDYIILSEIPGGTNDKNMALCKIIKDTINWIHSYGAGESNLTNRLFLDSNNKLLWGGTVTRGEDELLDIRFVRTSQDRINTEFDLPIGSSEFNESGNDITRYGFGYAVIGSSDNSADGSTQILFKRLAEDGSEISVSNEIFPIKNNGDTEIPGDKTGNAITVTNDGGLLLVGTVPSNSEFNFGRGGNDLYLIKINAFGDIEWQKPFGSRFDDEAVAALQSSDGKYVLLATSNFAGLKTVMLVKTDKNGNIK